ncbi:hypothetical protein CsSME_00025348 [Camellia sinensis var. sinensis]
MIDKKIEMIDKVYVQKEVELRMMQEKHESYFDGSQWLAENPTRILSCSADGNH